MRDTIFQPFFKWSNENGCWIMAPAPHLHRLKPPHLETFHCLDKSSKISYKEKRWICGQTVHVWWRLEIKVWFNPNNKGFGFFEKFRNFRTHHVDLQTCQSSCLFVVKHQLMRPISYSLPNLQIVWPESVATLKCAWGILDSKAFSETMCYKIANNWNVLENYHDWEVVRHYQKSIKSIRIKV